MAKTSAARQSVVLSFRTSRDTIARVEACQKKLAKDAPKGLSVSYADALRILFEMGLGACEEEMKGKRA